MREPNISVRYLCFMFSVNLSDMPSSISAIPAYIFLSYHCLLQSARRLQHEKDIVVSLSHESRALQSRLDAEQDAIQRMEAVLALVERFPSAEMAPGEGPTLQVHTRWLHTDQGSI